MLMTNSVGKNCVKSNILDDSKDSKLVSEQLDESTDEGVRGESALKGAELRCFVCLWAEVAAERK